MGCGVHAFGSTQAAKLHYIGGASPYLLLLDVDDSAVEEEEGGGGSGVVFATFGK